MGSARTPEAEQRRKERLARITLVYQRLGWTAQRLEQKAKLGKGALSHLKNGKRDVTTETLSKIAEATGARGAYLLDGEEPMFAPRARTIDPERKIIPLERAIVSLRAHHGMTSAQAEIFRSYHTAHGGAMSEGAYTGAGIDFLSEAKGALPREPEPDVDLGLMTKKKKPKR